MPSVPDIVNIFIVRCKIGKKMIPYQQLHHIDTCEVDDSEEESFLPLVVFLERRYFSTQYDFKIVLECVYLDFNRQ